MSRAYAGIGSRQTPKSVCVQMSEWAWLLAGAGWTCRTGGASGADAAWLAGCVRYTRARMYELYLPWPEFGDREHATLRRPLAAAYEIAAKYHPYWRGLSSPERALMARNVHQVLGRNLDDPVERVICWTPDGSVSGDSRQAGGTGMALRVVAGMVPDAEVCNVRRQEHLNRVKALCASAAIALQRK